MVEDVPLQGPSSSIPRRLQAHKSGSGRGVGAGQDRAGREPRRQGCAQARALQHVVPVVPQEPFLFVVSVYENNPYGRDGGYFQFRHFCRFILTECYFQFTIQFFGGILQGRKLSMVFYGGRDLSMLHNQFSLSLFSSSYVSICFIPFHPC